MNFEKIKSDIDLFVSNRKWQDYHTPKNLSMALSVEASELLEIFQWQMDNEKEYPKSASKTEVENEVADIFFLFSEILPSYGYRPRESFLL